MCGNDINVLYNYSWYTHDWVIKAIIFSCPFKKKSKLNNKFIQTVDFSKLKWTYSLIFAKLTLMYCSSFAELILK